MGDLEWVTSKVSRPPRREYTAKTHGSAEKGHFPIKAFHSRGSMPILRHDEE